MNQLLIFILSEQSNHEQIDCELVCRHNTSQLESLLTTLNIADKWFVCCLCKSTFPTLKEAETHAFDEFVELLKAGKVQDIDECGSKIFICYGCQKRFTDYDKYASHYLKVD